MKLFKYQETSVEWLVQKRFALLAHEMGLGKSAIVIAAADRLKIPKILIVCPSIARLTWQREFLKWSSVPRDIQIMTKRSERPRPSSGVVLCSFDYATNNFHHLAKEKYGLLVVDESHFLKSAEAKRTKAILGSSGIVHSAYRTWFLTGTPMPNHPGELWPMLYTFKATPDNFYKFSFRFCEGYEFNGRRVITGARRKSLPELKELLDPLMLRYLKQDVLKDLPPVICSELPVEGELEKLTPELKEEMASLHSILKSLENKTPTEQLQALSILASSIATLRRYCAMMKVKPISDLIKEELTNGAYEKIIIFGIHREALSSLEQNLRAFNPVKIDGSVNPANRQKAIDAFQLDDTCRVFIGNIQASGTNITLTKASQVIFIEQSWVPGDNAQAIARAARIGQKNSVYVRVASLAGTVDEKVQAILFSKTSEITELLGA